MKTAAVIGARSMLGSQLTAQLADRGVTVFKVGRSAANDDVHFDLRQAEADVPGGLSADVVFHCGASFAGDDSEGIRTNFTENASSALGVADLAKAMGAGTLIYAGSVFSNPSTDNFTSYGLTKAIAEQVLEWTIARQGGRFCSLRLPQLYDVEGRCCAHQPWFGRIIAYASRGQNMRMPRSQGPRNFLHVRDAASLMIRAADSAVRGVLDIAHPQSLTVDAIAEMAYEIFGQGGKVVIAQEKTPFRAIHFPDGGEAFRRLDLVPMVEMHEGIRMIRDAGTAGAFGPMDLS
ncbi:NAD-dependent epimerase/dehydratase family protein [Pararhizobium gei]|uniref:NAD-dependent epimerase/dehydratase family protein n=1 Tax=Pararhizobium gei TaxID=1395951 RepID=UPI0023D9B66F|nr:NAD(P)-dependent oxidoreductase [Rhizobium gei]